LIRNSVREIDLVSRFGGDEFIVLLTEASVGQARDVADRLRLNIANASISAGSERLNTTVSLGVAILTSEIASLDGLIEKADQALYKAKQLGGNQLVVA
jgi:diguanylate cyclase (GGDEF)-like protein